jgi:hypothetical protein
MQDLGNARHADTADADEVDVLDGVFHVFSPLVIGARFPFNFVLVVLRRRWQF